VTWTINTEYNIAARLSAVTDSYVGIRIDRGDDNDFAEVYLSAAATGLVSIITRWQQSGGGITTTTAISNIVTMFYLLQLRVGVLNAILPYYGIDTPQVPYLGAMIGDIDSWAGVPTRVGFIFQRTGGSETPIRRGFYDALWCDVPGA